MFNSSSNSLRHNHILYTDNSSITLAQEAISLLFYMSHWFSSKSGLQYQLLSQPIVQRMMWNSWVHLNKTIFSFTIRLSLMATHQPMLHLASTFGTFQLPHSSSVIIIDGIRHVTFATPRTLRLYLQPPPRQLSRPSRTERQQGSRIACLAWPFSWSKKPPATWLDLWRWPHLQNWPECIRLSHLETAGFKTSGPTRTSRILMDKVFRKESRVHPTCRSPCCQCYRPNTWKFGAIEMWKVPDSVTRFIIRIQEQECGWETWWPSKDLDPWYLGTGEIIKWWTFTEWWMIELKGMFVGINGGLCATTTEAELVLLWSKACDIPMAISRMEAISTKERNVWRPSISPFLSQASSAMIVETNLLELIVVGELWICQMTG